MKRFTTILGIITLFLVSLSHAQQRWTRTYGGTDSDEGYSVQQTTDGGYIVAGQTYSFVVSYSQVYLIKTNASGDTLWTRYYGGGHNQACGNSVQQTYDGGYIVTGWTYSYPSLSQVYLVKTNANGDTLWTKTYGGTGDDEGLSVQQTTDGGYIIAGYTLSYPPGKSDVYLIKTNASGDTLWTKTYGGTGEEWGFSVKQTQDTGYIIAGWSSSFGDIAQVYLIRTNALGDTLWTRNYGGMGDDDGARSVQQTQDGGYIVAGWTTNIPQDTIQAYLLKINALGDTLWTRKYGGAGFNYCRSVQQTQDGGYIMAGETNSYGDSFQVYLIKTNANGDTLWTRTYGGRVKTGVAPSSRPRTGGTLSQDGLPPSGRAGMTSTSSRRMRMGMWG